MKIKKKKAELEDWILTVKKCNFSDSKFSEVNVIKITRSSKNNNYGHTKYRFEMTLFRKSVVIYFWTVTYF